MIMLNKELKQIELTPIPDHVKNTFSLTHVAGRDAIAAQVEKDIDEWCKKQYDDGPRSHLGASIIGHECERFIWFGFRWMFYEDFSGRMQRLFQRGHLEEARIIEWLTGIGFTVHQTTADGKQHRIVFTEGHGGGSSDGIGEFPTRYGLTGLYLLLEFKTQKDKKFAILQGSGMQKEKPRHYTQASVYGRSLGLKHCLYIAVNKENDDLDIEVIELDWSLADAEMAKAEKIINSHTPPPRISDNPSFWSCKFCPAQGICHLGEPALKNCRSCMYSEAVADGQWHCHHYNKIIPKEFIPQGCDQWIPLAK